MFIELLDILRCVHPHEDSWLVGSFDELVDRHIIRGTLGCPVCGAEYLVRGGIADFRTAQLSEARPADSDGPDPVQSENPGASPPSDDADAMRLAALLGLAEPGGVAVLMGQWAECAPVLEGLVPGAQFLLVNPASPVFPFASAVRCDARIPIASAACRALAYDAAGAPAVTTSEAARVIRPAGRLVAPVSEPLPEGVAELARDGTHWVGERQGDPSGPVLRLTRRK